MTYKRKRPIPEKRRQLQAELCRKNKPSDHATGPKTAAGKRIVSQNALKHGNYDAETVLIKKWLHAQRKYTKSIGVDVQNLLPPPDADDRHI